MKFGFVIFLLLCIVGCKGKAPDLGGRWNLAMGPSNMQIEFGSGGQYSGTMAKPTGMAQVTGSYSVNGNILEMQPPSIVGPGGNATPPGGVMKVKMSSLGPDIIRLDAGDKQFTMTRVGPPK